MNFSDPDGDHITCNVIDKCPDFVAVDPSTCNSFLTPQNADGPEHPYEDPKSYNLSINASDAFGGSTVLYLVLSVNYGSSDIVWNWLRFLLPIVSSICGVLAAYKKRSMLFNLFAWWSRPRETVWRLNQEKTYKILEKDIPDWFGRKDYKVIRQRDPEKKLIKKLPVKFFIVDTILCGLCKINIPFDKQEEIAMSKIIRINLLRELVYLQVKAMRYRKPSNCFQSLLYKCSFLDTLIREPYQINPIKIDWDDATLNMKNKIKKELWNLGKNDDPVRLFVFGQDGRLLQKVRCEFDPQGWDLTLLQDATMKENKGGGASAIIELQDMSATMRETKCLRDISVQEESLKELHKEIDLKE